MMKKIIIYILFYNFLYASTLNEEKKFSFHIDTTYVNHFMNASKGQTEKFDNNLFDIEYKISQYSNIIDKIIIGTLKNSQNNRCLLLGVQKTWNNLTNKLSFEGTYSYAGEFILDSFSKCGNDGIYKTIKDNTGVGFAPYLYHGFEYDLHENISLEIGNVFPNLFILGLQVHF